MRRSKELYKRARRAIPSGVNSPVRHFEPHPFFVKRSQGAHMWDADGKRYLDLCNGYGALLLGHGRKEVVSAAASQMRRGTLYCAPTSQETELAEAITAAYPSMESVRLANTGGEATMAAIRLARGYTGRKKIIKFQGCYHGAHDAVLVGAGSGAAHAGAAVSDGVPFESAKNTLVVEYNDAAGLEDALRRHGADVAAVITEPVLANMGLILPKSGFLRALRRATKAAGALLIFDETVTGYRVGPGGAQGHFGTRPDITTLGKALGGGFAVSAVGGRRRIMERLAPGGSVYQASTFSGNPVCVAASLAATRVMRRLGPAMYGRLERQCARLASAIDDAASDAGIEHQTSRMASMLQVFFAPGPVTDYSSCKRSDEARFRRLFRGLLKRGVFVAPSQYEVAFLSAAQNDADVQAAAEAYQGAMGDAAR